MKIMFKYKKNPFIIAFVKINDYKNKKLGKTKYY